MLYILECSPDLMAFFVFYLLIIAAVMVYATVRAAREPNRSDGQPPPRMDYQEFSFRARRRTAIDSDRRFSPVQDSCCVDSDRRFAHLQDSWRNVYAKMFVDASTKIRL